MASDETVFIEARDAFVASLQPSERQRFAACASAEHLILEIQSIEALSRKPSLLRRAISKIKALDEVLCPYFESIGLFVQSHPEFAAIAWGALRLALQVGSKVALDRGADAVLTLLFSLPAISPPFSKSYFAPWNS